MTNIKGLILGIFIFVILIGTGIESAITYMNISIGRKWFDLFERKDRDE